MRSKKPPKRPRVTISSRGLLWINTAATREQLTRTRTFRYAFLFWDEKNQLIAIRPTTRKDKRAYRITYDRDCGARIATKCFCDVIGYDYSRARSFLAEWDEADRQFQIDLKHDQRDGQFPSANEGKPLPANECREERQPKKPTLKGGK